MRNRSVVVLGILGIALALASFAGPWWVVGFQGNSHVGPSTGTITYEPFGIVSVTQARWVPGGNQTNVSDYRYAPKTGTVFLAASAAVVAGLVLGAAMVVAAANERLARRRLDVVFGGSAGPATLTGLLGLFIFLPGAVDLDNPALVRFVPIDAFWGMGTWSELDASVTLTWGAGWAWYLLLAAAAVFLVAAFLRFWERLSLP